MQVLVTGSMGFIGSHLKNKLEALDHTVLAGDRKGTVPKVDWIFDLAAYGNFYDQTDKKLIWKVNNERAAKLIDNANKIDYKAIVMMSTSSVTLPVLTPYALSKLAMECYAQATAKVDNKPIVVARPFSVTGIGDHKTHLIPKLIESAFSGEEIKFVPDPVHDWIDVEDLVEALILLATNAKKHKGEVFEIGSGNQITNAEVLKMVEMITGKEVKVKIVKSLRKYDTKKWIANPAKLWNLGWQPKISIGQSIQSMVLSRCDTKNLFNL